MATIAFDWQAAVDELGEKFAQRAAAHDADDRFVSENWAEMKQRKLFSGMVPAELGGGGMRHSEMCRLIGQIARSCGSTALAFSMHQHLVAANVWNYRRGNPGEKLLRKVADSEAVLISTGAADWLSSNGTLEPSDGGFRFSAKKIFASGSPSGDILVTSGRYQDPEKGWQVLHFPVPMKAEGVRIDEVWKAMGMRGTGSHTVVLENVFVPAESVGVRRPMGAFHNLWNIVLTVAMPLVCSAYVGVAEAAARIARESAARRGDDGLTSVLVGEMENELATAQIALDSMVTLTNDFDFEPSVDRTNQILIRKTIATQAVIRTSEKALEAAGGGAYFRALGLERMLRDSFAGQFHPLPPKKQHRFTGRLAMGMDVQKAVEGIS